MSDSQHSPNVLIISNDASVVETIISNNNTGQEINARASMAEVLADSSILESNGIVIFDIGTTDNNVERSIDLAIQLKQTDPTQVLMIFGDKEPLNQILKSSIQPMLFRAFNKPISPNQLFLSFKSANTANKEFIEKRAAGEDILVIGPQENRSNIDLIAEERKANPLVFAGIGVAVLAVIAFLIFGGGNEEATPNNTVNEITEQTTDNVSQDLADVSSQLNDLNQKASNALLDGRLISPKGNNALEYYDRALDIDPYDSVAYEGKKAVSSALRKSYDNLLKKNNFDEAFEALNKITSIDPLNPDNEKLQSSLEKAVTAAAEKEKLANKPAKNSQSVAILEKIDKAKTQSSTKLQAEQALIRSIQSSISANNLIPPQSNNAYTLLSGALRSKKISREKSTPLLSSLTSQLLRQANASFARDNLDQTSNYMSYINRIDVSNPQLATLRSKVNARKIALAQNKSDQEAAAALKARQEAEERQRSEARIIPAKIISRSSPRYPRDAEKKNIQGWVQITFNVGTDGEPKNVEATTAQPTGYFEEAAIKSVKKWVFSPARNQSTGQAVVSQPITTKIRFELD